MEKQYRVESEQRLEQIIGSAKEKVKAKVVSTLDEIMKEFIGKSPLVFISTIDANGHVDVSPKGDPAGFVRITDEGNLLIPERPGNKLAFGFKNIIRNREIGLLFVIPNQRETLRVKGIASLHCDPELLQSFEVDSKPALLCTHVQVRECFMHCGKAFIRSKLWQPNEWDQTEDSIGVRQFAGLFGGGDAESIKKTNDALETAYKDELY